MFVTAPSIIEVSDFSLGYCPDPEPASLDAGALLDVHNLLPDRASSALVTRAGFRRVREEVVSGTAYQVIQVENYHINVSGESKTYIICILSNGLTTANNVKLYTIDLSDLSVQRIDDAGVTWDNPYAWHWGMGIDGSWWGGSKGNGMYSWDPSTNTWDGTASVGNWRTLVDDIDAGVDTSTEYARDYAFNGKETVAYSGDYFRPSRNIRHDTWETGEHYSRGDKVSLKGTWDTGVTYWKSFKCIKAHTAGASNKPQLGADTATYWEKIRLPLPQDEDNETNTDSWNFVPTAPETSVATWHNDRLWMRGDGYGPKDRLMFSAPVKFDKGADVPDVDFDPTDFAPGSDLRGPGGGWLSFNDGKHGGRIVGLKSFGSYLLVFKRKNVWVLAGESEESWTVRRLARGVGCLGPKSHVELDGLVYFLSDDGLMVTDGTAVEPAPGLENVRTWLKRRVDDFQVNKDDNEAEGLHPHVWSWDGYIFMSLCTPSSGGQYLTVVYDPRSQSFWKTDLPVRSVTKAHLQGVHKMYFCSDISYGSSRSLVYEYDKDDAGGFDDTGDDVYAGDPVPWYMQTAWWPFGLQHEERRIRRVWAVVKGLLNYTLTASRDWDLDDSPVNNPTRSVLVETPVHIEGRTFQDSHAVSFRLEGDAAPAAVYGVAVHTQPRRVRFHV